jgi:hypothetical protein
VLRGQEFTLLCQGPEFGSKHSHQESLELQLWMGWMPLAASGTHTHTHTHTHVHTHVHTHTYIHTCTHTQIKMKYFFSFFFSFVVCLFETGFPCVADCPGFFETGFPCVALAALKRSLSLSL